MGIDYMSMFSSATQNRTHFSGVSTGLDLGGMIDGILQKESQPMVRLQERQEQLTNRQKALQQLSEKMQEFRTFVNRWKLQSNFFKPTVSSTQQNAISGTATGYVPNISFQAQATQLAQSETVSSREFTGNASTRLQNIGATTPGTLTIKVDGQSFNINYNPEDTLQQLASRIQGQAGLRAFVTSSVSGSRFHIAAPDASVDIQSLQDTGAFLTRMGLLSDYTSQTLVTGSSTRLQDLGITSGTLDIEFFDLSTEALVEESVVYQETDTLAQLVDNINAVGAGKFEARMTDMGILQIMPTASASRIVNITDDGGNLAEKVNFGMGSVVSKDFSGETVSSTLADFGVITTEPTDYEIRVYDRITGTTRSLVFQYEDTDTLQTFINALNNPSDPDKGFIVATFDINRQLRISSADERYVILGHEDEENLVEAFGLGGTIAGAQTMVRQENTLGSFGVTTGGTLTLEAHNSANNTTQAFQIAYSSTDTIDDFIENVRLATKGTGEHSLFHVHIGTDDKLYIRGAYGNIHVRSLTDSSGGSFVSSLGLSSEVDTLSRFRSKVLTDDSSFPLSQFGVPDMEEKTLTIEYLDTTTGKKSSVKIDYESGDTLNSLLAEINGKGFFDARIEIDNRLYIKGATGNIRILTMDDDGGGLLSSLGLNTSRIASQTAKMQVNIGGVISELESNTNTFRDAVSGIHLNAYSTDIWSTITANTDIQETVSHIEEFVEEYNTMMEFLHTRLNEDPFEPEPGSEEPLTEEQILQGTLKNNSLVRQIFSEMRNMVYTSMDGGMNRLTYDFLTNMGIGSTDGLTEAKQNIMMGKIAIRTSSLESALLSNPEAVWEAFGVDTSYSYTNLYQSKALEGSATSLLSELGVSTAGRIELGYNDVSNNTVGTISVEYLPGDTLQSLIDAFNADANGLVRMTLDGTNQLSIQSTSPSVHIRNVADAQRITDPRQVGNLIDRLGLVATNQQTVPVQGFAERLSNYLHDYTKYNGRIDQTVGINGTLSQQIRRINSEITNWAKRLETRYVSLWARFARLEQNMANMQRQSDYMANAFQQMSGNKQ